MKTALHTKMLHRTDSIKGEVTISLIYYGQIHIGTVKTIGRCTQTQVLDVFKTVKQKTPGWTFTDNGKILLESLQKQ